MSNPSFRSILRDLMKTLGIARSIDVSRKSINDENGTIDRSSVYTKSCEHELIQGRLKNNLFSYTVGKFRNNENND